MNQVKNAARLAKLHVKGTPLMLYNAWDAGSVRSIVAAGAKAIATSSWFVAVAQGYQDGEDIPIKLVEEITARIVSTVDVPVSVDCEGGYSEDDNELARNVRATVIISLLSQGGR
jgi:2-methylisocitrate lyase-like PEP mutase family enzyme